MDDAARMTIVAQELMVSVEDLEELVAAADGAVIPLSLSDLIAVIAARDGLFLTEARRGKETRIQHPNGESGLRRWRFGR